MSRVVATSFRKRTARHHPPPRGTMFRKSKEYSLAELLEHPVLGLLMTSQGIERRSVELMVDMQSCERRRALVDEPVVD
jgi:hypothetical protein